MWTRTYLVLLLVRLYFAVSPSYIHPDENFQGPEVFAGSIFNYPYHRTWEFSDTAPIRSVFPLWPVYALPLLVLKGICVEAGAANVPPEILYYSLRILMFILSFVLEDWAIYELVRSSQHRKLAVTLTASSYVTWTYQTHTFSNSVETLAVLWSLVMIQRIRDNKHRPSLLSSAILGLVVTFGLFNRITFPAFVLAPAVCLIRHFARRPSSLIALAAAAGFTILTAVTSDTIFYHSSWAIQDLFTTPTIIPLNSLFYNSSTANLSQHGLHPRYQHLLVSLPLLLGPTVLLLPSARSKLLSLPIVSSISSLLLLSAFPHQEPRFLIPIVPLILVSIRLPYSMRHRRYWVASWVGFNVILGMLMGVYHQGGVVPAQIWLGQQQNQQTANGTHRNQLGKVFWFRTYSPPTYLLGDSGINTITMMGVPLAEMQAGIQLAIGPDCVKGKAVGLVAPWSSTDIDLWRATAHENGVHFEELWRTNKHLNLDDLDLMDDGIRRTLQRVIGRRGLVVWGVSRICAGGMGAALGGDW